MTSDRFDLLREVFGPYVDGLELVEYDDELVIREQDPDHDLHLKLVDDGEGRHLLGYVFNEDGVGVCRLGRWSGGRFVEGAFAVERCRAGRPVRARSEDGTWEVSVVDADGHRFQVAWRPPPSA